MSLSLFYWRAQYWTQYPRFGFSIVGSVVRMGGSTTSLYLLAALLLIQSTMVFFAPRANFWFVFNLSPGAPRSFLQSCFLSSTRLFLPRCRIFHLPLLNFIWFLSARFSRLLTSSWIAALLSSRAISTEFVLGGSNVEKRIFYSPYFIVFLFIVQRSDTVCSFPSPSPP